MKHSILLLILFAPLVGWAQTPVIEDATVNLTKSYIALAGLNFSPTGVAPTVTVGGDVVPTAGRRAPDPSAPVAPAPSCLCLSPRTQPPQPRPYAGSRPSCDDRRGVADDATLTPS